MKLFKIGVIAASMLAIGAGAASAQRPDTRQLSCNEVRTLVDRTGAITLTTGRNTYERFVAGDFWCESPYVRLATTVPTRDGQCTVLMCGQSRLYDD